jgi:hypothetical protein
MQADAPAPKAVHGLPVSGRLYGADLAARRVPGTKTETEELLRIESYALFHQFSFSGRLTRFTC